MPRFVGHPTKFKGHVIVDTDVNATRFVVEAELPTLTCYRLMLCCHYEHNRNLKHKITLEHDGSLPPWYTDTSPLDPIKTDSWQSRKN